MPQLIEDLLQPDTHQPIVTKYLGNKMMEKKKNKSIQSIQSFQSFQSIQSNQCIQSIQSQSQSQ